MSYDEYRKRSAQVIAKAWSDDDFKERLKSDPAGVLKEHGIAVPDGQKVKVVENTADTHHVVIPAKPDSMPSHEDLSDPGKIGPMLTTFMA